MCKTIKTFLLFTTLASAMLLSGCGGGSDGGTSGTSNPPGVSTPAQVTPAPVTVISGKA